VGWTLSKRSATVHFRGSACEDRATAAHSITRSARGKHQEVHMTKNEMKDAILEAKKEKGLSWERIAAGVGMDTVWVASACLGMNSMSEAQAGKVCEALGLGADVSDALQAFPHKAWDKTIPQDPLIYRLYEVVGVYGDSIKEVVHEKFGDGIMSAIDFSLHVDKQEDPKGDRVVITLNGKFLPYKSW
jgi:cyanate lyase